VPAALRRIDAARRCLESTDQSIKEIASYLCREVDEVEAKIASLRN